MGQSHPEIYYCGKYKTTIVKYYSSGMTAVAVNTQYIYNHYNHLAAEF